MVYKLIADDACPLSTVRRISISWPSHPLLVQLVANANKRRLKELLEDVESHVDINDRYNAALRGQTLVGPPANRRLSYGSSAVDTVETR